MDTDVTEHAAPEPRDFNFSSDDGRFILAHVYQLGAYRQLDRYRQVYQEAMKRNNGKLGVSGIFDVLHDVSCLAEDLDSLAVYLETKGFSHEKHKLWKQLRHYVRHDMRDVSSSPAQKGMTEKRHKFLGFKPGLIGELSFRSDEFTVGNHTIVIDEVADYLKWSNEIIADYVEQSRQLGHLKDQ